MVVEVVPITDCLGCSLDIVVHTTNHSDALYKLLDLVIASSMVPGKQQWLKGLVGLKTSQYLPKLISSKAP